jgi:hypothetical protein
MSGLTNPRRYGDKYVEHFHPVFNEFRKRNVRLMVTPEIVEEHAGNPLGLRPNFHSLELQFVLAYFRTISDRAMYLPIELPDAKGFGIVAARKGRPPEVLEGEAFSTVDGARHAIFLKRIAELGTGDAKEQANV